MGVKKIKKNNRENEKGMSLLETLPLIIVIISLLGFLLGFWGVVHRHILNSISSRSYAFETFRNRSNLLYFRDKGGEAGNSYEASEIRNHFSKKKRVGDQIYAAALPIRFPSSVQNNNNPGHHGEVIFDQGSIPRNGLAEDRTGVSPVWIQVSYGICLNANCGD